jgi:hypothetical protein
MHLKTGPIQPHHSSLFSAFDDNIIISHTPKLCSSVVLFVLFAVDKAYPCGASHSQIHPHLNGTNTQKPRHLMAYFLRRLPAQ